MVEIKNIVIRSFVIEILARQIGELTFTALPREIKSLIRKSENRFTLNS